MDNKKDQLFIGIMSGTSLDGIDCALVKFNSNAFQLLETYTYSYPEQFYLKLKQFISKETITLIEYGELDVELGKIIANSVNELLKKSKIEA